MVFEGKRGDFFPKKNREIWLGALVDPTETNPGNRHDARHGQHDFIHRGEFSQDNHQENEQQNRDAEVDPKGVRNLPNSFEGFGDERRHGRSQGGSGE